MTFAESAPPQEPETPVAGSEDELIDREMRGEHVPITPAKPQTDTKGAASAVKVKIKGVEYTLGEDGCYYIGDPADGVAALDEKRVPFRNRLAERERKESDATTATETRLAQLEAELREKQTTPPPPAHDPDDIDPETGDTYRVTAIREQRMMAKIQDQINAVRYEAHMLASEPKLARQKADLAAETDPKTGERINADVLDDSELSAQVDQIIAELPLASRMKPNMMKVVIAQVRGENWQRILANERDRVRKEIEEGRRITGEVRPPQTSKGGSRATDGYPLTDEVRDLARSNNMTLEEAAIVHAKAKKAGL